MHVSVDRGQGARKESHVGCDRYAVDQPFAVAHQARQSPLHRRRQLGDIVEEQRAAARGGDAAVAGDRLQLAGAAGCRRRDRTKEQLRDAGGVRTVTLNQDERRGRAAAARVQLAGHGVDVRPPLGDQQDAHIERCGPTQELAHPCNRRRMAGQLERSWTRVMQRRGRSSPAGGPCASESQCSAIYKVWLGVVQLRPVSHWVERDRAAGRNNYK